VATCELGLGDTSATDGLGADDDPEPLEPVGPSAELDVHPPTNTTVAARHPAIRHTEGEGLFISRSLRSRSVKTIGCPIAERSGNEPVLGGVAGSVGGLVCAVEFGADGRCVEGRRIPLGCGSSAGSLDEDGAVFADVELVVGGSVEGGAAGDSGVGLPGDAPVGGGGDGPGAGSAGAFFERAPMEFVAAGWLGLPVVVRGWGGAGALAGDGRGAALLVGIALGCGFAECPGDRRQRRGRGDRDRAGGDSDAELARVVVHPKPGPQVDGELRWIWAGIHYGNGYRELTKGSLGEDRRSNRRRRNRCAIGEEPVDDRPSFKVAWCAGRSREEDCATLPLEDSFAW